MTWFKSLNPLLVMVMTPLLLARWRGAPRPGASIRRLQKMAIGALIVASAYLLLAVAIWRHRREARRAGCGSPASSSIFTLGELYILPNGLGLFARLAPPRFGATTVAAWYLAIFTGSLAAGVVGTLWSGMDHQPLLRAARRDRDRVGGPAVAAASAGSADPGRVHGRAGIGIGRLTIL